MGPAAAWEQTGLFWLEAADTRTVCGSDSEARNRLAGPVSGLRATGRVVTLRPVMRERHLADPQLTDVLPDFVRGGEGAVPLHHGTLLAVPRRLSLNTQQQPETFVFNLYI